MSLSKVEDIVAIIGQNIASLTVVFATFSWKTVLPPPERFVEWTVGLMVAMTLIAFNVLRGYQAYTAIRKEREASKELIKKQSRKK